MNLFSILQPADKLHTVHQFQILWYVISGAPCEAVKQMPAVRVRVHVIGAKLRCVYLHSLVNNDSENYCMVNLNGFNSPLKYKVLRDIFPPVMYS